MLNRIGRCVVVMLLTLPLCGRCEDSKSVGKPHARKHYFDSFAGKRPPELRTEAEHWVNGTEKLTLQTLQGKVVWLEFNF